MARFSYTSFLDHMQPDAQYVGSPDNTTVYGSGVDMTGYSGVVFIATVAKGEIATYSLKAQQDTDAAYGTAADLTGTAVSFAIAVATDGFAFLEIQDPQERYVRPALVAPDVATARQASIVAIRYGKARGQDTNSDGEKHVMPAEGTA
jgi:hypothetical protein